MKNNIFILFLALFLFLGCDKNEKSSEAKILKYSVVSSNIKSINIDQVVVNESKNSVLLLLHDYFPEDSLPLTFTPEMKISMGATITPESGTPITFTDKIERVLYLVTAENGTQVNWYTSFRDNQIPNSGFEDWYVTTGMNSIPYSEPGKSEETTVWATANMGTSIYGVYGTEALTDGDNTLVRITTNESSAIPIMAGTIFTGKFDVNGVIKNPTDPQQATDLGIPFSLRPTAIKFKYKYQPGSYYIKATLNNPDNLFGGFTIDPLDGTDKCTIYAILEIRTKSSKEEIGRAEIISDETMDVLTEMALPITYVSSEKPTHITIVFTSSKDGDLFTGAVGSILIVDDLELLYE